MQYCDTSKIVIERCNKETVYNIVKKKHYAKTWTASSNIYGIYYDSGEHQFFDGKQLKLIGTVIYGNPVGFRDVKSIAELDDKPINAEPKETEELIEEEDGLHCKVCKTKWKDQEDFDSHLTRRFHMEQV